MNGDRLLVMHELTEFDKQLVWSSRLQENHRSFKMNLERKKNLKRVKETERCQYVTGWNGKHYITNQLCPKISSNTNSKPLSDPLNRYVGVVIEMDWNENDFKVRGTKKTCGSRSTSRSCQKRVFFLLEERSCRLSASTDSSHFQLWKKLQPS